MERNNEEALRREVEMAKQEEMVPGIPETGTALEAAFEALRETIKNGSKEEAQAEIRRLEQLVEERFEEAA